MPTAFRLRGLFAPPLVKVSSPVPVIEPLVVPVPPLATRTGMSKSKSSSVRVRPSHAVRLVSAEMSSPATSADPTVSQVATPRAERTRTN